MSTEDNPSTTITKESNEKSAERVRKPNTLQPMVNDENPRPPSQKTLEQDAEQEATTAGNTSDPELVPESMIPPIAAEVVVNTTSEAEPNALPANDNIDDDIIIVEEAPSSSEKDEPNTLAKELKQFMANNALFAEQLEQMKKKQLAFEECKLVLKAVWTAVDNVSAIELSLTDTLAEAKATLLEHCEVAKGHADNIHELIGRFAKSDQEERKSTEPANGLQTLINNLSSKSDTMQSHMDDLTAIVKTLAADLLYIKGSITSGDAKANPGLKYVNFASVPGKVSGRPTPPAIDWATAPQINATADAQLLQENPPQPVKYTTPCVLCSGTDHLVSGCKPYGTSKERKERARELNVCTYCALVYTPGPKGEHTECTALTRRCIHCRDHLDVEFTYHHNAFCSLMSHKKLKRNEKKRKLADVESSEQASSPPKKPTPPPSGGRREKAHRPRGGSSRGGHTGDARRARDKR